MAEEASIVLKLSDQTSAGFSSIRRSSEQMGKEFDQLSGRISALQTKNKSLNESYASLQARLVDAKKAVQEATKAYKENGDEANRTNLTKAQEEYKNLTDQLHDFKAASADVRKEIRQLQEEQRKLEDGGGISGRRGEGGLSSWGVAASALGKQLGNAASGFATYALGSGLGDTDASLISDAFSGVLGGAAAGAVAGPLGAAIGAAVGGLSGVITGMTDRAAKEDEAFKSYRDAIVAAATQFSEAALEGGTGTAAQREIDRTAFSALLGSSDDATTLLGAIKELSNVTPYVYDDLTGIARQLAIYDSTNADLYGNIVKLGDAGSALGMTTSTMEGLAQLLGKIGDSEAYQATFTRSLRNYGINPASIFAEYFGISTEDANKLMSSGDLTGADAMSAIFSVLESRYGGMMATQAGTFSGAMSTRSGLESELQNFMGTGFTSVRTEALQEQNDWMQRFVLGDAYTIIGRSQAQKENLEDAYYRDIMGGIFAGDEPTVVDETVAAEIKTLRDEYSSLLAEYDGADEQRQMEIGARISAVYDEAQALVSAALEASPKLDAWDEAALQTADYAGQIVGILNAYKDSWTYNKANERGRNGYVREEILAEIDGYSSFVSANANSAVAAKPRRAMGQRVIPYDNFPILAHEGEVLLTAAEARQQGNTPQPIMISGNTFNVRQESDIDAIAAALAEKLALAAAVIA